LWVVVVMIVGMSDLSYLPGVSNSRPGSKPVRGPSQPVGSRQPTPPRLSAINRRLAPSANESSPSMRVRDPNKRRNPVTSFLGGLFEPRVPTPTWVETNQKDGVFGNRKKSVPVDSKYQSLRHRPMPPPDLSLVDEMATHPGGFGMPVMRNGEEAMLYNNITEDDWGRLVVAPGYRETRDPRLPRYSSSEFVLQPYRPSSDELQRKKYGQ
jgi:hypothetical protein